MTLPTSQPPIPHAPIVQPLNYERLAADFANDLLHNLRNHGAAEDCLETWVPDEDPVKSILNMVEAAQSADIQEIAIEVSRTTLPDARVPELRGLLAGLGNVEFRDTGTAWIVTVGQMRDWSAFVKAAPALRAGLQRLFAQLDHEGPLHEASEDMQATEDGISLKLLPSRDERPLVAKARHEGGRSPVERAVLDAVCRRIEGLPLVEAADHGAIRALHDILDPASPGPIKGILRPEIADPAFGVAVRLVRTIVRGHLKWIGVDRQSNFFEMPVSESWAALSSVERVAALNIVCDSLMAASGYAAGQLHVLDIEPDLLERPVRVTVTFGETVPPAAKPDLIREAERRMKRQLDPALYVLHETLKDNNGIRRL
jgi:hypothetical protein